MARKILFLDIDGVLNSVRTCVATGGYPMELEERAGFDWTAIGLLQRLCDSAGVQIVLSSAWRITHAYQDVGKAFDLPIIDRTPSLCGPRGAEIAAWLAQHNDIEQYAIVDDNSDMLDGQRPHFVQTDPQEGLSWSSFTKLAGIFGASPYEGEARRREWRSTALAWE